MKAIVYRVINRMENNSSNGPGRKHYWFIRNHIEWERRDMFDVGLRPNHMNGTIFTLERCFNRNKATYK
jgi:hypothetical protein